jgi:hypothetical protein
MKKAILIFLLLGNITPAYADQGGWVMVDASGKVISGTIVCTPDVCGDVNSPYAKATLQPGQRYVQITKADPVTNNVAGPNVVAQTPPNQTVSAKVDPVTNVATVTTTIVEPLAPRVTVIKETETTYAVEQPVPVTTVKAPVIEIVEPETIKEDPAFLDWLDLINQMFMALFANFSWAWDF